MPVFYDPNIDGNFIPRKMFKHWIFYVCKIFKFRIVPCEDFDAGECLRHCINYIKKLKSSNSHILLSRTKLFINYRNNLSNAVLRIINKKDYLCIEKLTRPTYKVNVCLFYILYKRNFPHSIRGINANFKNGIHLGVFINVDC